MMDCWLVDSGELNDLTVPRADSLLTQPIDQGDT